MLDIRRLSVVVPAAILSVCFSSALAQEKDADDAKKLLKDGLGQFQAKQYMAAQKTLMTEGAKWDALGEPEQTQRAECLDKLPGAIKGQAAAEEALAGATKSLENNQLAEAEKGFAAAAGSEFLPDAKRAAAQEQLALVKQRQDAAKTPRPDTPVLAAAPDGTPSAATRDTPPPPAYRDLGTEPPFIVEETPTERLAQIRALAKQKAAFEIAEAIKRANELLAKPDAGQKEYDAAAQAATVAENVLNAAKTYFDAKEFRAHEDEVLQVKQFVDVNRGKWEQVQARIVREQIRTVEGKRIIQQQQALKAQVASLTADMQAAVRQRKFDQALDISDKILRIDPGNQSISEQRQILVQVDLLRQQRGADNERALEWEKQAVDIRQEEIPWYRLINYPKDWREITERRNRAFGEGSESESEQNRVTIQKLKRKIQEARLTGREFSQVIEFLRVTSGVDMQVKWAVLQMAGIEQNTPIKDVILTDKSVETVLKKVLEDVGGATELTYVIDDGVVTISTKQDLSAPAYRKTNVYDIRDLLFVVTDHAGPELNLNTSGGGNDTSSCGSIFGCTNNDNNNNQNRGAIVADLLRLITSTIDKDSWRDPWGSGDVGAISEMGGQLVVTQTAENHRQLLDLIGKLREAKTLQITVECRFLSVSSGFLNSVGLDLQTYFNIGSRLGNSAAYDPYTGASVPFKTGSTGWSTVGESAPGVKNLTPIAVRQGTRSTFTDMLGASSPINSGISIGKLLSAPSVSVTGTFLDDIQVDFILEATQANSSSRSMTAPRVTIFNGQRSYVTFGTQQAYVSRVTPIVSANVIAYAPTVAFIPTGTVLTVQGTVSADRRYVMMDVHPTISQLNGFTNYFTVVASTDPNGGAATGYGFIQLPNVTVQDVWTDVSVPDKGTLLLGGQNASGELEREKGTPILSQIPIINRAFTNRGKVRDENTALILIKPTIIIHREQEDEQFPSSP